MGKIISLKHDYCFKHLLLNEKIRRYFISDSLDIPLKEIRSVRLANTYLWKQYRKQKQGILDLLVELNDTSRVNIELQIELLKYWDKRSLFYMSKLFTEGLLSGQEYDKLKRCICISILGFDRDEDPRYNRIYRLRDETGQEFTDLFEIHIIELSKPLNGTDRMDEWIQLFNSETEEELDMLQAKTKNEGILEAIRELKIMQMGKVIRAIHDDRLKQRRDRYAREAYVRDEGIRQGIEQGEDRLNRLILCLIANGRQEDLEKAAQDKAYREQLYKEFRL